MKNLLNNASEKYLGRKFVLFVINIGIADLLLIYAAFWKPELLTTLCTFVASLLGLYSGANLINSYSGRLMGSFKSKKSGGTVNE